MKLTDWTKVGVIGVDAGVVWLGDPCYILHKDSLPIALGNSWPEFVERLVSPAVQFNYDKGHAGLGVVVSAGFGDGIYDVFVRYVQGSSRIAEVKIVFIEGETD